MKQDGAGAVQDWIIKVFRFVLAALDKEAVPSEDDDSAVISMIDKPMLCHYFRESIQGCFHFFQIYVKGEMELVSQ